VYCWYFAYGSNLNKERLRSRIGAWKESKRAKLVGFRLTFDSRGYADIIEDPQSIVYGAVYLVTPEQLKKLDEYEGVRWGVYVRRRVRVVTEEGGTLDAVTYVKKEKNPFSKPDEWYLQLILNGLSEHGYGSEILGYVKRIAQQSSNK